MGAYFSTADLSVVGIAADIAGAVILALGLSFKRPERMREEVPRRVSAPTTPGNIAIPFPQAQIESMARQRAEARWGMALLVFGFLMQALVYFFESSGRLTGGRERIGAALLGILVWLVAWVGVKTYVIADEWTTLVRIPEGVGPVGLAFGETLEMRDGQQTDLAIPREPPRIIRVVARLGFKRPE